MECKRPMPFGSRLRSLLEAIRRSSFIDVPSCALKQSYTWKIVFLTDYIQNLGQLVETCPSCSPIGLVKKAVRGARQIPQAVQGYMWGKAERFQTSEQLNTLHLEEKEAQSPAAVPKVHDLRLTVIARPHESRRGRTLVQRGWKGCKATEISFHALLGHREALTQTTMTGLRELPQWVPKNCEVWGGI